MQGRIAIRPYASKRTLCLLHLLETESPRKLIHAPCAAQIGSKSARLRAKVMNACMH